MSSLPADRSIESRFLWTGRKPIRLARSFADMEALRARIREAYRRDLIGAKAARVLMALVDFHGNEGAHPSREALARRAGCCVKTVSRATRRGAVLDLLDVRSRPPIVIRQASRVRLVRQTNDYRLLLPLSLPCALPELLPVFKVKEGKGFQGNDSRDKMSHSDEAETVRAALRAMPAASESLESIAKRRQEARDREWLAARGWTD